MIPQPSKPKIPFRQIRALQDPQKKTLFVYAAFPESIARAAVETQHLDASPDWLASRMTWVKPSWAWMMYRCGYSFKDKGQERVLALEMKWDDFETLLGHARVNEHQNHKATVQAKEEAQGENDGKEVARNERKPKGRPRKSGYVMIQWDPERTPALGRLEHRSIQIGIQGDLKKKWLDEWVQSISDVTERAQKLKSALDEKSSLTTAELVEMGLVPDESVFEVQHHLQEILRMDRRDD